MNIKLDKDTMPDELYNMLLQHFVNKAAEMGLPLTGQSRFDDWNISCTFKPPLQ